MRAFYEALLGGNWIRRLVAKESMELRFRNYFLQAKALMLNWLFLDLMCHVGLFNVRLLLFGKLCVSLATSAYVLMVIFLHNIAFIR